jgi:hypothetical protein
MWSHPLDRLKLRYSHAAGPEDLSARSGWCGCFIFFGIFAVVLIVIFVTVNRAG